jgi:hypothetical protein
MAVSVNVTAQLGGINAKVKKMVKLGQFALANQVHADSNMYAPMLSTDLRNQSNISADNKQIVYNTPYARRQYYNQFINYTTPGTGPKWDQKAKSIHKNDWLRITEEAMRQ